MPLVSGDYDFGFNYPTSYFRIRAQGDGVRFTTENVYSNVITTSLADALTGSKRTL